MRDGSGEGGGEEEGAQTHLVLVQCKRLLAQDQPLLAPQPCSQPVLLGADPPSPNDRVRARDLRACRRQAVVVEGEVWRRRARIGRPVAGRWVRVGCGASRWDGRSGSRGREGRGGGVRAGPGTVAGRHALLVRVSRGRERAELGRKGGPPCAGWPGDEASSGSNHSAAAGRPVAKTD